jgi:glycosyltransferase involved in cell wall biosynthesis
MNKISVVIIAKDEAVRIARTIASAVDFVDEVLVVDGGSRDDTIEISIANRARVIENPWPGFAEQRNFGAIAAKNDWIFMLDADEVFDADLAAFVVKFVTEPVNDQFAFEFTRVGDFLGRWLPGQDRVKHTRLYNRQKHKYRQVEVHEGIDVSPQEIQTGKGIILHYGFRSISDHVIRFNKYTDLEAKQRYADGQKFSLTSFIFRPPVRFAYQMLLRRLWRQGVVGVFVSLLWVYYDLTIQMKLYELQTLKSSVKRTAGDSL